MKLTTDQKKSYAKANSMSVQQAVAILEKMSDDELKVLFPEKVISTVGNRKQFDADKFDPTAGRIATSTFVKDQMIVSRISAQAFSIDPEDPSGQRKADDRKCTVYFLGKNGEEIPYTMFKEPNPYWSVLIGERNFKADVVFTRAKEDSPATAYVRELHVIEETLKNKTTLLALAAMKSGNKLHTLSL